MDVAKKIAEGLNWKLIQVEDVFEIDEDKQGFFVVTLKPKKFLDPADFKTVCRLARDLGGDGQYVNISRSWKVPGPLAKKPVGSQMPTSLPTSVPASLPTTKSVFEFLPLAALVSMPFQSRADLPDPDLQELAESIREHGVIEPIVVREKDGFYQIVMGERRVKASRMARQGDIAAVVKVLSDEEAYALQLIENVQRKDLSDMEKAHAIDRMLKTFGYTQEVLAKKLGKTQGWVSQRLAMLQIPESITRVIKQGELTEGQAREILAASPEKQEKIVDAINETGAVPSMRELREIVHPEQKPATVYCDHCGEPVTSPVHIEGKFYHDDCVEDAKAASLPGLTPESPKFTPDTPNEPETEKKVKHSLPEPLLTGYAWTCPCGAKFIINHVDLPGGKKVEHRLEACGA